MPELEPGVGAPVVRSFAFQFNSVGILTAGGHAVYVPTPGDYLLDAWFTIDTVWDGTTPLADLGLFGASKDGLFDTLGASATLTLFCALDTAESTTATGLLSPDGNANFRLAQFGSSTAPAGVLPAKFATNDPICVCVSQTGLPGGADPVSTKGAGRLFLVTASAINE